MVRPRLGPLEGVPIHQIMGGASVPLATFPSGDNRLEVKVTDKTANISVTGSATFSVAGE